MRGTRMRGTRTSIARVAVIILICVAGRAAAGVYSGGAGTAGDPYLISTAADLKEVMVTYADHGMHFVLTNDIEFLPGLVTVYWPIGHPTAPFSGTFDGAGFCIRDLTLRYVHYVGLFGGISASARIMNLGLERAQITTEFSGSLLVGINAGGTITNCYATGSILATGTYTGDVSDCGLLVGVNAGGTITNCYATGSISASGAALADPGVGDVFNLGALAGSNSGTITNCYATGYILASGSYVGNIGGLVGNCNTRKKENGTITNCYATGYISISSFNVEYLGGLVGRNGKAGTITNCYATGSVSTTTKGTSHAIGGLVGGNSGTITNCYATGYVSASSAYYLVDLCECSGLGGLVGSNRGTITDCYAAGKILVNSDLLAHSIGALVGSNGGTIDSTSFWNITTYILWGSDGGTGIWPEQMKTRSTFTDAPASWDFVNTWQMQEGVTFPYLHIGAGAPPPVRGDLDGDGDVDFNDFQIMANNWLAGKN